MFEEFKEFVDSVQMKAYENSQMTPEQEQFNSMISSDEDVVDVISKHAI